MNKPTLANLYRQATRDAAGSALPEAEMLIALAHGERPADAERVVAEIAQSALQSDLLHFARALEPASNALSAELRATFAEDRPYFSHARAQAARPRTAAGRWRNVRRIVVGMAAVMIAGVAIWSQQHQTLSRGAPLAGTRDQDRIFSAFNERAVANNQTDEIFNGGFHDDVIFHPTDG